MSATPPYEAQKKAQRWTYRIASHGGHCYDLVAFAKPCAKLEFLGVAIDEDVIPLGRLACSALPMLDIASVVPT